MKYFIFFALVCSTFIINFYHFRLIADREPKLEAISKLVGEKTLFIGEEEDFIYLGEHLQNNFGTAGYLSLKDYTEQINSNSSFDSQWQIIYFLQLGYKSRTDRPTKAMVKSITSLQSKSKLKISAEGENFKIYEYDPTSTKK